MCAGCPCSVPQHVRLVDFPCGAGAKWPGVLSRTCPVWCSCAEPFFLSHIQCHYRHALRDGTLVKPDYIEQFTNAAADGVCAVLVRSPLLCCRLLACQYAAARVYYVIRDSCSPIPIMSVGRVCFAAGFSHASTL